VSRNLRIWFEGKRGKKITSYEDYLANTSSFHEEEKVLVVNEDENLTIYELLSLHINITVKLTAEAKAIRQPIIERDER
jgi:hypothetical protein